MYGRQLRPVSSERTTPVISPSGGDGGGGLGGGEGGGGDGGGGLGGGLGGGEGGGDGGGGDGGGGLGESSVACAGQSPPCCAPGKSLGIHQTVPPKVCGCA